MAFAGSVIEGLKTCVRVGGGFRSESSTSSGRIRSRATRCSLTDQYSTLRIRPGASETEVKKAFRSLALQYHPDVCKGNNCGVQFHQINQAYDALMSSLRAHKSNSNLFVGQEEEDNYEYLGEEDLWEEWMGWEGAGTRDYTSHINPYL